MANIDVTRLLNLPPKERKAEALRLFHEQRKQDASAKPTPQEDKLEKVLEAVGALSKEMQDIKAAQELILASLGKE